jgi:hypothetical protein
MPVQVPVADPETAAEAPVVKFADAVLTLCAATTAVPSLTISPALALAELDEADAWPSLRKPPRALAPDDALLAALAAKVVTALQEATEAALTVAAPSCISSALTLPVAAAALAAAASM